MCSSLILLMLQMMPLSSQSKVPKCQQSVHLVFSTKIPKVFLNASKRAHIERFIGLAKTVKEIFWSNSKIQLIQHFQIYLYKSRVDLMVQT